MDHLNIYIYIYIFFFLPYASPYICNVQSDQETFEHNHIAKMAVTELEEEDEIQASATEQIQKEAAATRLGGRPIAPVYIRKGDLARFAEAKKRSSLDQYEKNLQQMIMATEAADKLTTSIMET